MIKILDYHNLNRRWALAGSPSSSPDQWGDIICVPMMTKQKEAQPAPPPPPSDEVVLLTEIRDLLKK